MPQLKDVDGKTVPVLSRKLRNPPVFTTKCEKHYLNRNGEIMILRKKMVWVVMTTKGNLADAGLKHVDLRQTADGWEYLVREADLIRYLRTVTPPFRVI